MFYDDETSLDELYQVVTTLFYSKWQIPTENMLQSVSTNKMDQICLQVLKLLTQLLHLR